jgi:hypothetical protein
MKFLVNQVQSHLVGLLKRVLTNSFVNTSIDLNVLVHLFVDRIDRLESNIKERKTMEVQLKSTLKEDNKLITEL